VELGKADHGGHHRASVGEEIEIRLPENPSTGFLWTQPQYDPAALEFLGSSYESPGTRPGAAGTRVVRFRATRPADSTVRLRNVRPTVPDAPGASEYEVHIATTPG
jgi:inhibitor of cysteine peptidase